MKNTEAVILCRRAQAGDVGARDALVLAHVRLGHILAWEWTPVLASYLGTALDKDELTTEFVLLLMERVIPQFDVDGPMTFRARARAQMRDRMLARVRKLSRRQALLPQAAEHAKRESEPEESVGQPGDLERLIRSAEERGTVEPEELRALWLRASTDMTWAEVAAQLGQNTETCKHRSAIALKMLKEADRTWNS